MDPQALMKFLEKLRVTWLQVTPARWTMLLGSGWRGKEDLRLISTGEAMPPDFPARLLPLGDELWNLYGPTETTVWSSGYQVHGLKAPVTFGHPFPNNRFYVLDARHQLAPHGVKGRLFIGGEALARGYTNRPELTVARFVADPFSGVPGARMYDTGDVVRWTAGGSLLGLIRRDKCRGRRS
ncbi:MAG: non-ribosomal peptide synthetase component F [Verrucomicrobiales bacterium]|jgi:non-ribosomal peptide synthetase component F